MNSTTGYSGKPLINKLGIKSGMKLYIFNPPDNYFSLLEDLPPEARLIKRPAHGIDFIHLFVKDSNELKKYINKAKEYLNRNGMLWISWPKRTSGLKTDLNENILRETGLKTGLVDIKVCSIDNLWSGLKFVYRLKDR